MKAAVKTMILSWVMAAAVLSAPKAHAQGTQTTPVTITMIGCGMNGANGTPGGACFLTISGPAVGPAGCSGNTIVWDPVASINGQAVTAQLTSAYIAGRQVNFVLGSSCWPQWPIYPTLLYYQMH